MISPNWNSGLPELRSFTRFGPSYGQVCEAEEYVGKGEEKNKSSPFLADRFTNRVTQGTPGETMLSKLYERRIYFH